MKFLILTALLLGALTAFGETPEEQRERTHRNVHEMRVLMEESDARAKNEARNAVIGLFAGGSPGSAGSGSGDVQSISQMRNELNQSFERIENMFPCLGANIDVDDGQAILICGDNQGYAKNDNFEVSERDEFTFEDNRKTNIYLPEAPAKEVTP